METKELHALHFSFFIKKKEYKANMIRINQAIEERNEGVMKYKEV